MEKKLTKSNDKKIAGICAGFAEYLGWDVTLTRALHAIATILLAAFPGLIIYIVLCFILPDPEQK